MLLNFLSQLVLSSPSDVFNVLPLSDSGCRTKIVSNDFCDVAVKLHLVEVLLVELSHLGKSLSNCILLGMSVTTLCGSLGSNPARQRSLEYFDSFSIQPLLTEITFEQTQQDQKLV